MDYISEASTLKDYEYVDIIQKPETLFSLQNKFIEVHLIKNCSFQGYVQAIDPITSSIILLIPYEDSFKTSLIPGHAIIIISELTPEPHVKLPECKKELVSDVDVKERKAKIVAWLKENLLPVSEVEETILFGNASLLPPYTVADICTSNPMVAMQMRKIIERMPQDYNPNNTTS